MPSLKKKVMCIINKKSMLLDVFFLKGLLDVVNQIIIYECFVSKVACKLR